MAWCRPPFYYLNRKPPTADFIARQFWGISSHFGKSSIEPVAMCHHTHTHTHKNRQEFGAGREEWTSELGIWAGAWCQKAQRVAVAVRRLNSNASPSSLYIQINGSPLCLLAGWRNRSKQQQQQQQHSEKYKNSRRRRRNNNWAAYSTTHWRHREKVAWGCVKMGCRLMILPVVLCRAHRYSPPPGWFPSLLSPPAEMTKLLRAREFYIILQVLLSSLSQLDLSHTHSSSLSL